MAETDPQDPLPEPSFKWRRALVFGTAILVAAFIYWRAPTLNADMTLTLVGWLLLLNVIDRVAYYGGASAADLIGLIANFRLRRGDGPRDSR